MSGIVAVIPLLGKSDSMAADLRAMLSGLSHPYADRVEVQEIDDRFAVGFVQRPPVRKGIVSLASANSLCCAFDGHLYDQLSSGHRSDAERVMAHYQTLESVADLSNLDGLYAGFVYDGGSGRVVTFADPSGLKRLYEFRTERCLYLSSEVKAFLWLPDPPDRVNQAAVSTFFTHGVVGAQNTWLEGVKLLPSGTAVLRIGADATFTPAKSAKPKTDSKSISFQEAREQLAHLFQNAIERRALDQASVGARLSGGLDSRAIVAGLVKAGRTDIQTFTFGRAGSSDVRTARRVAKRARSKHREFIFTADNWFKNRTEAVWISDGHLDVQNMHGMPDVFDYQDLDVHLSGDLGGGVIGGLFLDSWPDMPTSTVISHRLRRFSGESSAYNFHYFDERYPFYDRGLMRFLESLPAKYLRGSRLYSSMLLRAYPAFYRGIPWQHTGLPIWAPPIWHKWWRLGLVGTTRLLDSLIRGDVDRSFHLNKKWFRAAPVSGLVSDLLLSPTAMFGDYLDPILSANRVREHLIGRRDHTEFLSKLLTFEIWLRSVRAKGPIAA